MRTQLVLAALLALAVPAANAATEIRTQRVNFAHGANSAVVEGSITGYETFDYVLGASKGQYMNVSMATKNTATYFNILAPGESEVAFFNGSVSENQYEGTLPASGDYKIRVYMMRSAARRNEKADYRLEMIITGTSGASPKSAGNPLAHDALVPGTPYHATGEIRCVMATGKPAGSCPFGVTRKGNGSGVVTVTKPDGRKRAISFDQGKATGADVSSADPGEFSASREGDSSIVRIGQERYEIPDGVIFGG
jgi:hypothetical protein